MTPEVEQAMIKVFVKDYRFDKSYAEMLIKKIKEELCSTTTKN